MRWKSFLPQSLSKRLRGSLWRWSFIWGSRIKFRLIQNFKSPYRSDQRLKQPHWTKCGENLFRLHCREGFIVSMNRDLFSLRFYCSAPPLFPVCLIPPSCDWWTLHKQRVKESNWKWFTTLTPGGHSRYGTHIWIQCSKAHPVIYRSSQGAMDKWYLSFVSSKATILLLLANVISSVSQLNIA